MKIGYIASGDGCILFSSFAFLFTILKRIALILVGGFNIMLKDKRNLYDKEKLCEDQRNTLLICSLILGVGAILSFFINQHMAIMIFII